MASWNAGKNSDALFDKAQRLMPGGVNSPVRAFKSVSSRPYFVDRASGAHVVDVDGNAYIDFVGSWGPMILGHAPDCVQKALTAAISRGTSFGAPHEGEIALAERICSLMPQIEMLRMVSSGTEATMSAIRLARGFTGRPRIIKFEGCYHGHADSFLIKAGSGVATLGIPDSPGVTEGTAKDTLNATYNNLDSVKALFAAEGAAIAAVIVEPVAGNMGCVPPVPGFLEGLRTLCDTYGALLIFDEVITGFRIAKGGAREVYGVTADLTTLGKILGGGLPVGAYGGRRDIMSRMAPSGPVYQAGTLSGNPLATAAGLATLNKLSEDKDLYSELDRKGAQMEAILRETAAAHGIPICINRVGSMLGFFLNAGKVRTWSEVCASDKEGFSVLFGELLRHGVSIAPSAFEAMFVSAAHTDELLEQSRRAFDAAFAAVAAHRGTK